MITVISALPGFGKTLLFSYLMAQKTCVEGYDLYRNSCKFIEKYNNNGFKFSYPKQKHVTYFNGHARISVMGRPVKIPYVLNPWYLGLPTKESEVDLVFPGSVLFIDEAQRYYNSRMSYYFPDYVSRFYEMHRHYRLTIYLIAQRAGLIDKNIRSIAQEFIYIDRLEKEEDSLGNLIQAKWYIHRFNCYSDLEKYEEGNKELGTEDIIVCNENLYKFFDTHFFEFLYLNGNQDFSQEWLRPYRLMPDICEKLKEVWSATPPPTFFGDKKVAEA